MRGSRPSLAILLVSLAAFAAHGAAAQPAAEAYRFGVVSFYNPRIMYLKYQPLVDYLSVTTGHPWELVISPSYETTVQALCEGRLTIAYLGPLTYVRAHASCGAVPLVRLRSGGSNTYRSLIMVRRASTLHRLTDLAGRRFGFGSPLSTSSHLAPRAMLQAAGLVAGRDLECRYFEHHERAARAVLLGEVDACGIRDIIGHRFEDRGLRVLAESEPLPNFPFVVQARAPAAVRELLLRALVQLPRSDPSARATIAGWDAELAAGFAPCRDGEYDGIRVLARRVFGPAFLTMTESQLECSAGER